MPDLALRTLGGAVVHANDESFAERENLVRPGAAAFDPSAFGHKGKVYDGWETRRRRTPGHDHAIVRLGIPGVVRGVVVDTSWFTGNYPPEVSVEAAGVEGYPGADALAAAEWTTLVPRSPVRGDAANPFPVADPHRYTHVRLSIYPDGGVARFRVHGEPVADPRFLVTEGLDLAALENGGGVAGCSDQFYSSPANLIAPGLTRNMGEGWENARRRGPGNDWVELCLAAHGEVRLLELDTSYFLFNAPGAARVAGCDESAADPADPAAWFPLLERTALLPDTRHRFAVADPRPATRLRLEVFPDGGMARLRAYGRPSAAGRARLWLRWLNTLPETQLRAALAAAGASEAGAAAVLAARPVARWAALPADVAGRLATAG
ncbi:allantoicase [Marinitenerispora sediminis]|uniref:Probable allantoicase n=1 Tax=Marinitenerispora sediminis TaxID=1931232 RepID=A0A368T144_9ACTN|nr:allantoicase [Marinitenerispora sediminis]RCV53699.1 allantoicase [Marinitenerispora sediminis]RCV56087.1 allantoicase [Marinitenerispora sediminis]